MALRNDGFFFIHTFITRKNRGPESGQLPGNQKWTLIRHRPRAQTWGSSSHPSGSVQHLIKEQFVGTHVSGYSVKVTLWACNRRCVSPIRTDEAYMSERRCKLCTRLQTRETTP